MREAQSLFRAIKTLFCIIAILIVTLSFANPVLAQEVYWFPHTPLIDGDDVKGDNSAYDCPPPRAHLYKYMFHGYLYGHWNEEGSNTPDKRHEDDGKRIGGAITPRCPPSKPNCSDDEKQIVVVAVGFSNWTKEICADQGPGTYQLKTDPPDAAFCGGNPWSFYWKAHQSEDVNKHIVFVDCAYIGGIAWFWQNDQRPLSGMTKGMYSNCNDVLRAWPAYAGGPLDPSQVQVVLIKTSDSGERTSPNYPLIPLPHSQGKFTNCLSSSPFHACILMGEIAQITRNLFTPPPGDNYKPFNNVQQVFVHSRISGAYAKPIHGESPLNPEPYAYESGHAMKWLIQAQVDDVNNPGSSSFPGPLDYNRHDAPWMDWGAYMWAADTRVPCENCPIPGTANIDHPPLTWVQETSAHEPLPFEFCESGQQCDFQAVSGSGATQHPDNTHPSQCGRSKVADEMMYFFCNSPYTVPWFTASRAGCPHVQVPQNRCDERLLGPN